MSIDPGALIQRWFSEVWNQGREETVDELFAEGAVSHGLGDAATDVRSPEEFKQFVRNMRSAMPGLQISVDDVIVQADKAVARVTLEGSHDGDGMGIAATCRRISVRGMVMIQVRNGQIVESWNNWDQLGLLQQTGVIPAADGASRFLARSVN